MDRFPPLRLASFRLDRALRLACAVAAAGVLLASALRAQDTDPGPGAGDASPEPVLRAGIEFHPPESGLLSAREQKLVALVVYPGPESTADWPSIEKLCAKLEKLKTQFVAVEVPSPAPRSVTKILGPLESVPVIAVVDLRGRVVRRWNGEFPSPRKFKGDVKLRIASNHARAQALGKLDELLERASYAIRLEKWRDAVDAYNEAVKLDPQSGSDEKKKLDEIRSRLDAEIEKRVEQAESNVRADPTGTITKLEEIQREFPIPEVKRRLQNRINEIVKRFRGY